MSIFSNIWGTIKSIPSQYKAAGQMLWERLGRGVDTSKLTGSMVGTTTTGTTLPPAPTTTTPSSPPLSTYLGTPSGYPTGGAYIDPTTQQSIPYTAPTQPTSTYYQPSVTQPTTTYQPLTGYQAPTPTGQPIGEGYTPPPQAPSGAAGVSYQPQQQISPEMQQQLSAAGYSYTPYQAPSGVSGISSHTGLLGGVSAGLGLPAATTTDQEETMEIPQGSTLSGIAQQRGLSLQQLLAANPQITDPNRIQAGASLNIPRAPQPQGLRLPSIVTKEGALDLTATEAGLSQIKDLLKSPLTKQTQSQVMEYLEQSKNVLLQGLQQLQPLPQEPMPKLEFIADDQNELDQLQKYENEQIEAISRQLGMPQNITDLENTIKELNATDQAFNAIIEDVNSDPDFPKGLARRRIAAIEKEKGVRMNALQNKIGLLQQSLELKRTEFKDRLGITERAVKRQLDKQAEEKKLAQSQVDMLIDSGGIANMSAMELAQLAQSAGYTLTSLQKIRDAVKSKNQVKIDKAENDLLKQQQTMDLATQREARLAGGETGGGTTGDGIVTEPTDEDIAAELAGETPTTTDGTTIFNTSPLSAIAGWWSNLWK